MKLENNKQYYLSDFVKKLKESRQEFSPVRGEGVESEDKKNNGKAVEDILDKTKKYDGGLKKEKKRENPRDGKDYNKTTLDVNFRYEPSDEYKKRVKSQTKGFPSYNNEKNSKIKEENGGLDFSGNEEFYDNIKNKAIGVAKKSQELKHAGLKSHNLPKENFKDNTLFKENKMKRLHFKKTVFLNETEMIKKIPDDMKINGNKFLMKDAADNEYMVECVEDNFVKGYIHTNVVGYRNNAKLNETFERMKSLAAYKSENAPTKFNENETVGKMLSESKKMFNVEATPKDKFLKTLVE